MNNMIELVEICEDTQVKLDIKTNESLIRYAWGNEQLKTWFITKTNKAFLPKGSRLLYKIICEKTSGPISAYETYPRVDDIVSDVDGENLKIIQII